MSTATAPGPRTPLRELALLFLKLGATSFGGPAVHIAMMEEEVVRRRGWLTRQEFLDLVGATNLIPGPNSTEMAIHIGRVRAGAPGLMVAGACFILPAALLVLACAWVYVRFGTVPAAAALLYGVKPAVLVVVVAALWSLGRTALRERFALAVAAAATLLLAVGADELLVLLAAGAASFAASSRRARTTALALALPSWLAVSGATPGALALFLVFAKIGAVLYGSGYVLFAFMRADLVERHGWLTEAQLLDAVAVGQVTPGPLFTSATFVGYVLAGPAGAAAATAGIFLPAFLFVAASAPLLARLRHSPGVRAFLDGVNVASLAMMAVVAFALARHAIVDASTAAIAAASAVVLARFRINSAWLVPAAALAGLAAHALR